MPRAGRYFSQGRFGLSFLVFFEGLDSSEPKSAFLAQESACLR